MHNNHVMTADQLRLRGIHGHRLAEQLRRNGLYLVLGDVYCDRRPTTTDKCRAISL